MVIARSRLRLEALEVRVVPTAEIEPNNTLATATAFITPSDTLTGSISSVADVDHFKANLGQGDLIRVRFDPPWNDRLAIAPATEVINAQGEVIVSSLDGHVLTVTVQAAGTYYLRFFAGQVFGDFTGNYSIQTQTSSFVGVTESESNDTPASADPVSTFNNFRGSLSSVSDPDYFSFSGTAGRAVVIKFGHRPGASPAVRLFDPGGALIASGLDGQGIQAMLPAAGTYRYSIQSDNAGGAITGTYVGNINMVAGPIVDPEPGNTFLNATPWSVTPTTSRVVGTLSSLNDVDVFAVTLSTVGAYVFRPESPFLSISTQGRIIRIYNEMGQLVRYSIQNGDAFSISGVLHPPELRQRLYVTVQATEEVGLGAYSLSGVISVPFPTQRDVPIYFHDYTGQTTHLGWGPAQPYPADSRAQSVAEFEALFDVYDVDVTQTYPGAGVEHVGVGVGEFADHTGPSGGDGGWGIRRPSGDSMNDVAGGAGTAIYWTFHPTRHEALHATGMPHARHPLNIMAYDQQAPLNMVGSAFAFPWTDQRIPTEYTMNWRANLDLVLQAGRFAQETEPNNSPAAAQPLDPLLAEMEADASPRNERVIILGRIANSTDADYYSLTVDAGETVVFDIEAAELQSSLNAELAIFNPAGNLVATGNDALDLDTGLFSVDPYLTYQFPSAGTYSIRVTGRVGTVGEYRFKATTQQALDTAGPRVRANFPESTLPQPSTRQLIVWFNDQIDPATLTPENIILTGPSGTLSGTATFDPMDSTLIWLADAPLGVGTYTLTLKGGPNGLTDLRGNRFDGETDGSFAWPEVSGNGTPGGDFSYSFVINSADNTPAVITSAVYSEHPSNRGRFQFEFDSGLDIQSVFAGNWEIRGAGPDGAFDTADDRFLPVDVYDDKIINVWWYSRLQVYARGIPEAGTYRVEGTIRDIAGHTIPVSRQFVIGESSLHHGPVVVDVSVQPTTTVTTPITDISVTLGGAVNPATLTTSSFQLRYSEDPDFFDGDDTFIADADGMIAWDAVNRRATFRAASPLARGYYLIELSAGPGGIASPTGKLLDGEFLDSHIEGNNLFVLWPESPSGDGLPGGDYRATFNVWSANSAPVVLDETPELNPTLEDDTDPAGEQPAEFLSGAVADADPDPKAMAVVGSTESIGIWQYSLDNGASWLPIGAVSQSSAVLIGSTDLVRFVPAADANGLATITYHAWDQTSGVEGSRVDLTSAGSRGGSTAFSTGSQTATLTVTPVNDAPRFTKGPDQSVAEDSGPQTVGVWATGIAAGPANEIGQGLSFEVTSNTNVAIFATQPAVAADGTLTFTPAANAFGTATVTLRLRDNGGTSAGGQDTSDPQIFTITIRPVNDAPSFIKGSDQSVAEDAGLQTVAGWATGMTAGPANEAIQSLSFEVTSNPNAALFAVLPAIAANGTLTYRPAANAFGTATVTVRLRDNGGTADGGLDTSPEQSFTITVRPVNDAPSFVGGSDQTIDEDSGPASFPAWATVLAAGPPNESNQSIAFVVVGNSNPTLFAAAPAIGADGTLTFTPAANANGDATISVQIADDGGTTDGGVDLGNTATFTIRVLPVNDAPAAADDSVTAVVGKPLLINVLANDSDVDDDVLLLASFTQPANGTLRRQGSSLIYTTRLRAAGSDAFTYTVSDGKGGSATGSVAITVVDTVAPRIQTVRLYYGPSAYVDASGLSRAILPWEKLHRIAVVFSEGVIVDPAALTLIGIGGAIDTTFAYDPATRTATWIPTAPVSNNRITMRLAAAGVVDESGNQLTADWARTIGLLTGDYDGNGVVTDADLRAIRSKFGTRNQFADVDGNGLVNATDFAIAQANKGRRLR